MDETNNTKQAFWVALGSLCSFGFAIVSSAILSRYFDKADYGTYKQVMYVYNTLLTVFTLGLPKAFSYFLPRVDVAQAKNLIKKITNLFFILGAIFSVFLFVGAQPIADFLKNQDLKLAIRIFSPVPLMMLPTMGLEGILSTFRKNKFIAVYTVTTRLFMLICVATPVIFFNGGYIEALIGFCLSSFISFLLALYLKFMPIKGKGNDKCHISYKEIFKFSLPLLTASLWGVLIHSIDQFFISRYFGTEVFAEFSNGALELPFVGMIVGACATVLSPIFSRMNHEKVDPKKEIFPLWIGVFKKSAMLIYPLLLYCIVFADVIMIVLYGKQYEASADYFRIKTTIDFFRVVVYAPLIINIGKVKFYSNVHMYSAIILIVLEFLSVLTIKSPIAIMVISVLSTIGRIIVMLAFIAKYFDVKLYQLFPIKLLLEIIIPSIIIVIVEHYVFVSLFNMNLIVVLFVSFAIYILLYALYCFFKKIDYISLIKPLIKKQ